jgi:hypothetical protein
LRAEAHVSSEFEGPTPDRHNQGVDCLLGRWSVTYKRGCTCSTLGYYPAMFETSLERLALMVGLACFAGFLFLNHMVARGATQTCDQRWIKDWRLPSGVPRMGMAWAPVMRGITQLGGPVLRYSIALPAAFMLYRLGHSKAAAWLVMALGSGWIVDGVLKHIFRRQRPTIVPHLSRAGGPSFPSGHTLGSNVERRRLRRGDNYCRPDFIRGSI